MLATWSRSFPRFRQFACCNLEFSLAVAITLVFVLRHSIEVRIFHFSVNHKRNETYKILKLFPPPFFFSDSNSSQHLFQKDHNISVAEAHFLDSMIFVEFSMFLFDVSRLLYANKYHYKPYIDSRLFLPTKELPL